MTVGVLLLTEDGTGAALFNHLRRHDADEMLNILTLTINEQMTGTVLQPHIEQRIAQLDTGSGVLILMDQFHTVVESVLEQMGSRFYLRVVTGLNLAMLNAVLEHSDADLDALARYAMNDARQSVQIAYSCDADPSS